MERARESSGCVLQLHILQNGIDIGVWVGECLIGALCELTLIHLCAKWGSGDVVQLGHLIFPPQRHLRLPPWLVNVLFLITGVHEHKLPGLNFGDSYAGL